MINIVNSTPFLRTSREFPEDLRIIADQLQKSYVDIANVVNARTIGLFPINNPAITGELYFTPSKQQTFRQVYTFTSTASINHNIRNVKPGQFINCFGSYTNGTNTFGLFFASSVAIAGQITFYVTSTQIVFLTGAGAPSITPNGKGFIVLSWLSDP